MKFFTNLNSNSVLLENSKDRKVNKLISDNFGTTDFEEIRRIRTKLLRKIPNARARKERWLYQILSYIIDGDIPPTQYNTFNDFLHWLNEHQADDPNIEAENFNGVPFEYVQEYYQNNMHKANPDETAKYKPTPKLNHVNGFTIRRVDSEEETEELGRTVFNGERWCILRDGLYYEIIGYEATVYFVVNDATFKTAKPIELEELSQILKSMGKDEMAEKILTYDDGYGEGCEAIEEDDYFKIVTLENGLPPYDEYGLSAMVVVRFPDGNFNVWSRYNIPNCFDGYIITADDITKIIGANAYEIFPFVSPVTEKRNRVVTITEAQYRQLLNEGVESKNMSAAKHYLYDKYGTDERGALNIIGRIKHDIPNSRLAQCKFMLGLVRMFCNSELSNAEEIFSINKTLKFVASDAHVNEYDRNLNGLSFEEITERFAEVSTADSERDREELGSLRFEENNNYRIVPIDDFKQATEYRQYTEWCVTRSESNYNSYTSDGLGQFYFCLREGFESVPKEVGENAPLDEYGLSMVAVCVDKDGDLRTCTCRWNHSNGGNDNIMDTKQISQLVGRNFYDVFKPNNKWANALAETKQRLANGEDPFKVFKKCRPFPIAESGGQTVDGLIAGYLLGKFVVVRNNEIVNDFGFDNFYGFREGFCKVQNGDVFNFIDENGQLISKTWYKGAGEFQNGFATVGNRRFKKNVINTQGQLICKDWYDDIGCFNEGCAMVALKEGRRMKYNFINTNGELISELWFDDYQEFNNGFAEVGVNKNYNYINTQGELLSPDQWFCDGSGSFETYTWGNETIKLAKVNIHAEDGIRWKSNCIRDDGTLLSPDLWFDSLYGFSGYGVAVVKINGKSNLLRLDGKLVSPNKWFDYVSGQFPCGFSIVKYGDVYNFVDINGNLINKQGFKAASYFRQTDNIAFVKLLDGRTAYVDTNGNVCELVNTSTNPDY